MLLARVVPTCCQALMARLWLNLTGDIAKSKYFIFLVYQNPVFCDTMHFLFICRNIFATSLFISKISTWTQHVNRLFCEEKRNNKERKIISIYRNLLNGWNAINSYLIFVICFTRAKFLENKIYTEKTRKLRQKTQKIANFLRYYGKIHSKLPIFCVITAKYTVNCQYFALNL